MGLLETIPAFMMCKYMYWWKVAKNNLLIVTNSIGTFILGSTNKMMTTPSWNQLYYMYFIQWVIEWLIKFSISHFYSTVTATANVSVPNIESVDGLLTLYTVNKLCCDKECQKGVALLNTWSALILFDSTWLNSSYGLYLDTLSVHVA